MPCNDGRGPLRYVNVNKNQNIQTYYREKKNQEKRFWGTKLLFTISTSFHSYAIGDNSHDTKNTTADKLVHH